MLTPSPLALTKEGILAYGAYGSGKSHAWALIRKWYELTDTPGRFYIISTEWEMAHRVAEGYLDGYPGNNFFTNAEIHEATDFASLLDVTQKARANATDIDWIVIDSAGAAWEWVQDEYCQKNFQKSASGYRADGGKRLNWQVINERYREWYQPNVFRWPGHRFLCCQADKISTEGDWADEQPVQRKYRPFDNLKPVSQKALPHQVHSVLYFYKRSRDEYRISKVDDPSRIWKEDDMQVHDFVVDYLQGPAGWERT